MACDICLGKNEKKCPVCGGPQEMEECPRCEGYGVVDCTAYDIVTEDVKSVKPDEYFSLPDTEEQAIAIGLRFCKADACRCPSCWGEGKILEDY